MTDLLTLEPVVHSNEQQQAHHGAAASPPEDRLGHHGYGGGGGHLPPQQQQLPHQGAAESSMGQSVSTATSPTVTPLHSSVSPGSSISSSPHEKLNMSAKSKGSRIFIRFKMAASYRHY